MFVLSCIPASTHAVAPTVSGMFTVVFPGAQGTSSYTVVWSYPASVVQGKNLTVVASLFLNGLTGLKLYVDTYTLSAFIDLPGKGFLGEGNVSSFSGCNRPGGCGSPLIYPGGHWGPENITVATGNPSIVLSRGNYTAEVSVGFVTSVWYDRPVSLDYQEYGSKVVGNVTIMSTQSAASPGSLVQYLGFVAFGGAVGPVLLYAISRATRRMPARHFVPGVWRIP
jgi:hypothetical protein